MSTGAISPFHPVATAAVSASQVSANIRLTGGGGTVLVTNTTASLAYVNLGSDSSVQATSADMPVLPNNKVLLQAGSLVSHGAAIVATGTGLILFTRGTGATI